MEFPDDLPVAVVGGNGFTVGEWEFVMVVMDFDRGARCSQIDFGGAWGGFRNLPLGEDGAAVFAAIDGEFAIWIGFAVIQNLLPALISCPFG
jgi:hypothetical protein